MQRATKRKQLEWIQREAEVSLRKVQFDAWQRRIMERDARNRKQQREAVRERKLARKKDIESRRLQKLKTSRRIWDRKLKNHAEMKSLEKKKRKKESQERVASRTEQIEAASRHRQEKLQRRKVKVDRKWKTLFPEKPPPRPTKPAPQTSTRSPLVLSRQHAVSTFSKQWNTKLGQAKQRIAAEISDRIAQKVSKLTDTSKQHEMAYKKICRKNRVESDEKASTARQRVAAQKLRLAKLGELFDNRMMEKAKKLLDNETATYERVLELHTKMWEKCAESAVNTKDKNAHNLANRSKLCANEETYVNARASRVREQLRKAFHKKQELNKETQALLNSINLQRLQSHYERLLLARKKQNDMALRRAKTVSDKETRDAKHLQYLQRWHLLRTHRKTCDGYRRERVLGGEEIPSIPGYVDMLNDCLESES